MLEFTIIITASYIKSHPETIIITKVINSLNHIKTDHTNVNVILAHDYNSHPDYEKYFIYLDTFVQNFNKTQNKYNLIIVKRNNHGGLTGNIRNAMKYVNTKYILMMQHDLPFCKNVNIDTIIDDMNSCDDLKHVRFNKRRNIKAGWDVDKDNFFNKHNIKIKNNYMSTLCWSDTNHLSRTDYYNDIVLSYCKDGDYMENTLNKMNTIATHKTFGTYIFGKFIDTRCIEHLDGRNFVCKKY